MKRLLLLLACLLALCTGVCAAEPVISEMKTDCTLTGSGSCQVKIDGDNITYSLRVAPGDMGRVIGRHGRIAKEIRTLMKAAGNRENKRVTVDILD